ncbi:hypothetical protein GCM10010230_27370 [Streptomyces narbonensis]|nr:hypothetical protein GCM10010230_27370 [Streptomyces narbonensis]
MTATPAEATVTERAWKGFKGGLWRDAVDVRDFIQQNYTPYEGDGSFLAGPTERTTAVWKAVTDEFPEERAKGVHDVSYDVPSTITSHAPGYIDRDKDLIVGLQTDAPLKRAIMPNGGWRMVAGALETYGYPVSPDPREGLHPVPQDPQRRCLRRVHPRDPRRPQGRHRPRTPRRLRPRPHHRRLPPCRALPLILACAPPIGAGVKAILDPEARRPGDPETRRPGGPEARRPGGPEARRPGGPERRSALCSGVVTRRDAAGFRRTA